MRLPTMNRFSMRHIFSRSSFSHFRYSMFHKSATPLDETDRKRRKMSTECESASQDHDQQKTDIYQIVAIDNPANFNEIPDPSQIVDLSSEEFKVVKTKLTFVDKSEGIKRYFECPSSAVQISAPRGFGKSTFMNMLETFLMITTDEDAKPISNRESSDNYKMFMNLKLGQYHGDFVKEHCGQYPVISMSLKSVEGTTTEEILDSLKRAICETYRKHLYLLEEAPDGSKRFKNWEISEELETFLLYCEVDRLKELSETDLTFALTYLSEILYDHFNKKVVILVDDADAPIMKALINNVDYLTLTDVKDTIMEMLSEALKDNKYLERSLVSSCVRLSLPDGYPWEPNNQYHALFLRGKYFRETYGFTEQEVHNLLENDAFQAVKDLDGVKKWYNGYQISNKDGPTIYNGWCVINYLSNSIANQKKMFGHYWAKSGLLDTLKQLFVNHRIQEKVNQLVQGGNITIIVDEPTDVNILELKSKISNPHGELNGSQVDFFFQLLCDDGLLTAVEEYENGALLKIPNLEMKTAIQRNCYTQSLFEVDYRLKPENIEKYIKALKQLLRITTSVEEESEIEKSEERATKKCEEAMCNIVNAISLLFSDGAAIPSNESELHRILFYLAYNNRHFVTQSHRAVVKISEELRDSKTNDSYQSKRKESRARENECDMCVTLGTVAVIFEFKFLQDEEAENSKAALQQIIEKTYFKLFDENEYKNVKTKMFVGMCVKKNLNVTAHYLVNDIDLANAKNVAGCGKK